MLVQHIALVPEAGGVSPSELLRVSAALQKQLGTQFGPVWGIQATVDPFSEIEDVPAGYRPIVLGPPEATGPKTGIHLDENGQPFARVILGPGWSVAASRMCLEMVINPFGQRTLSAPSPRSDQGPAEFLVEACGAFGEIPRPYAVNDVAVADFCTPSFYDSTASRAGDRYSFRGSLAAPLQLLRGGHLSWFDAISNSWWLRTFHDELPTDLSLGALRLNTKSVRELVKRHEPSRSLTVVSQEPLEMRVGFSWLHEQASAGARARAQRLRELLGAPLDESEGRVLSAPTELFPSGRGKPPQPHRLAAVKTLSREADGRAREEAESDARTEDFGEESAIERVAAPSLESATEAPAQDEGSAPAPPVLAKRPELRPPEQTRDTAAPTVPPPSTSPASTPPSSTPPPYPSRRPSSIAPTAMLEVPARSESFGIGTLLAGAAVVGLGLTIWLRSDGSRSVQSPQAGRGAPPAAAAVGATPPENTSAQGAAAHRDGGIAPVPQQNASVETPAHVGPKSERTPSSGGAGSNGKVHEGAEKTRHRQRLNAPSASPAADEAARDAEPHAGIENLFDTRR